MKPSGEDMHSIMEGEDGVEPHDVFVDLGTLIVEGRVPGGAWATGRGYGEGPHCAGVGISAPALAVNRHECDPNNSFLCKRAENLQKHMQLLWQNAIPMCIEVLLCADCQCGQQKAQSPDIANVPSSSDLLLEQWMVTVSSKRCQESSQITVRGLFQAVRSQLHFSQLAAWWSSSKGSKPAHVNYRVTVPGEAFASQFQRRPLEHSFPVAGLSRSSAIKVTVRSLPRMEMVPHIVCPLHDDSKVEKKLEQDGDHLGAVGGIKSGVAVADEQTIWGHGKDGVRKKCAMEAGTGPLLGDSLLDPPPSLDLFARRIQSPSRCGSPSLEAPEYLLFGRTPVPAVRPQGVGGRGLVGRWRENSPPSPPMSSQSQRRLGRQGLARRRDANNVATNATVEVGTSWQKPCGDPPAAHILPGLVDDRMQNPCTRPGKHHCRCAYDEDLEPLTSTPETNLKTSSVGFGTATPPPPPPAAVAAASCCKNITPSSSDTSTNAFRCQQGSSDESFKSTTVQKGSLSKKLESAGKAKLNLELSQREVEEVLAVLRDRNLPPNPGMGKTLSESASHISKSTAIVPSTAKPMQVFNMSSLPSTSPTTDKADLLMGAILRSSEKERVTKCGKHKCDIKGARTCKSKACDKCRLGKSAKSVVADQEVDDDLIDERVIQTEPMGRNSKSRTPQLTLASSSSNSSQAQKQPQPTSPIKKHKHGPLGGKINNVNHSPKCLSVSVNNSKDHQHNISDTVPLKQLNKDYYSPSVVVRTESSTVGINDEKAQCYGRSEKQTELSTKSAAEERASPFLNKSLNQLKNLFKGEIIKTQAQENGWEGVPDRPVPSALDKAKFRRSLDSAASMVFHSRTGLPLTSSPAPVRKGTCFDFDSSLNSVSAIRSALFESVPATPPDDTLSLSSDDAESESGARSPSSPGIGGPILSPLGPSSWSHYTLAPCASLLGSFEESVLNGRLEPVSTVQGFTADLGASGSFCPRHLVLPVTVFFYTLGDNDKVSTPYLGHINLGKKGYNVPRSGTIQVTLFNPLGTVVKMFVVMYDLADMPPNSQTFLRQRTLYMPANPPQEMQSDNMQKWLRYLIHLRFSSSKSGRIYLHTDIRMIIFRKSDVDTATAHGMEMAYELRSFTHGPTNPKFSPYK